MDDQACRWGAVLFWWDGTPGFGPRTCQEEPMALEQLTGQLMIVDDSRSNAPGLTLDSDDLDRIVQSLLDCGYPKLAGRIQLMIDPRDPRATR